MYKWGNNEEKLDFIYALEASEKLSKHDEACLRGLLSDENSEIRYSACEMLALFPSDQNEQILREMLRDHDRLVRACACDSLAFGRSEETLKILMKACRDRTSLVRGYAVLSLADVQHNLHAAPDKTIDFLLTLEKKERSVWVQICLYRSLFLLGRSVYGEKLLSMLNNRYYKNRCLVLSSIEEIVGKKLDYLLPNLKIVLLQRLSIESAGSVYAKLQKVIRILHCNGD